MILLTLVYPVCLHKDSPVIVRLPERTIQPWQKLMNDMHIANTDVSKTFPNNSIFNLIQPIICQMYLLHQSESNCSNMKASSRLYLNWQEKWSPLQRCTAGGAGDTWQPLQVHFPADCTQFAGKKLTLSDGCQGSTWLLPLMVKHWGANRAKLVTSGSYKITDRWCEVPLSLLDRFYFSFVSTVSLSLSLSPLSPVDRDKCKPWIR